MELISEIIIIVCLGLILGSFATALAYRVPLGISWGAKRSSCTSCGTVLGAIDLIPVLSWCFNKGLCRHCKVLISVSYPLIEITCMAMCIAVYSVYGFGVLGILIISAVPFLLALLLIDIKYMILPNQLVAILFFIGVMRLLFFWSVDKFSYGAGIEILINYVLAALIFSLLLWGTGALMSKILKKESLGFGDVKFFGMAGLWFGLEALPLFMIISGGIAVVFALVWRQVKKSDVFPFGPALIFTFFILLLYKGILLT
jgi:prepilin signal peptidase PulO-like enzyme (type II secretory pathway)